MYCSAFFTCHSDQDRPYATPKFVFPSRLNKIQRALLPILPQPQASPLGVTFPRFGSKAASELWPRQKMERGSAVLGDSIFRIQLLPNFQQVLKKSMGFFFNGIVLGLGIGYPMVLRSHPWV